MPREVNLADIDKVGFARELDALHIELVADLGPADLEHLRKMVLWGRLCTAAGYATAWIAPNPISPLLMGQGTMFRWIVMHHIGHRGYDKVPAVPAHLTSRHFARGWRRYIDWLDWIHPAGWCFMHNDQHHMRAGQEADPDLVERSTKALREWNVPVIVRDIVAFVFACTWKFLSMAPISIRGLHILKRRRRGEHETLSEVESLNQFFDVTDKRGRAQWTRLFNPMSEEGRQLWAECYLPYAALRFGLVPLLFGLALGPVAWSAVLINSLIAEVVTNLLAFFTTLPNHTGEDVPRFEGRTHGKAEWYVRQVTHSVDYTGGTNLPDFLQGYLNYQIEHHLWPDLPMLKYQQAQPKVEAICRKYGVPYIRESIWRRSALMWRVITGRASAPVGVMHHA